MSYTTRPTSPTPRPIPNMARDPRRPETRSERLRPRRPQPAGSPLEQVLAAAALGFVLFLLLSVVAFGLWQVWHMGRIYPGVSVAGIPVGGMRPEEAALRIVQSIPYPQTGAIVVRDQQQTWNFTPADLGLILDPAASAARAFRVGRSGGILQRLSEQAAARSAGRELPAVIVFDRRQAAQKLKQIAAQAERPVVEASLSVNGTEVSAVPGQIGRRLNLESMLTQVESQVARLQDGVLSLAIEEIRPQFLDLSPQAETARTILQQPLTLTLPDGQNDEKGPWVVDQAALAGMLALGPTPTAQGMEFRVALRDDALIAYLANLAPELSLYPQNARFIFNDETRKLEVVQPAVIGRALNVEESLRAIQEQVKRGKHSVPLAFNFTPPAITDQVNGEELGITELVHAQTSYYYGSSSERVQNISAAAEKFHGVLVAPGETFSMAETMGEVSLDNGYAEALIIYGGRTIKGVGGGVCQVSTTLFRAAFFSGFPILERHPHAYRVYYYEKIAGNQINPDLAGLDATVFVPVVDFKFVNDTPYWLLMETYVRPENASITWKFYSTSDGRTVDWTTTGPTNVKEPPKPLYRENPELSNGEVRQVDWEAEGAEVGIVRRVLKNGELYFEDAFNTLYEPWQAVYEYGPGTEGMPPSDADE